LVTFAALFVGVQFMIDIGTSVLLVPMTASGRELPWLALLNQVGFIMFTGVPIAVGIAVLKYRLLDIDVIINRTLVYGSLTAILVALYFAVIVVLPGQRALGRSSGVSPPRGGDALAIVPDADSE
jgi:hypothetical protein